jgi:hypothetical protein
MVCTQNLEVAKLITQAQLVVGLKFVPVAGPTETLEVLATIWIPCPQTPDEPCRHDVIHMALRPSLLEILAARRQFALFAQS